MATRTGSGANRFAGLIADGIHVDALTLRVALAAKRQGIFLVSDCMALAGTEGTEFHLGGRRILRAGAIGLQAKTIGGGEGDHGHGRFPSGE